MNFQLYNDKVWTFPLKCKNAAGVVQPFPPSPTFAVVSSNPASLGVAVNNFGGFMLVLTPKVKLSPGLTVTVSNTGMDPLVFAADIVPNPDRLSVDVDTAAATTTPQNVPAAPGP